MASDTRKQKRAEPCSQRAADDSVEAMDGMAKGMQFRFVTVIQPLKEASSKIQSDDTTWEWKYAVHKVMASDYCKRNCFDYSSLFDKDFDADAIERIFLDEVHLDDAGNEYVARQLIKDLGLRDLTEKSQ
jgi:hypothetical protein